MSQLPLGMTYDPNPYTESMPLAETQRILREQHNLINAGDSAFPWQLLSHSSAQAFYNIGSTGRFVHPLYGVIRATYVKIANPDESLISAGNPVGWAPALDGFQWEVTDDYSRSSPVDLCGIRAGYALAADMTHEWVITQGINIQSVDYHGTEPVVGTILSWDSSGQVKEAGGADNPLGTLVSVTGLMTLDATHYEIQPGCIRINCK